MVPARVVPAHALALVGLCGGGGFVVSLFGWGIQEKSDAVESTVGQTMEGTPLLPEVVPGFYPEASRDQLEEIAARHEGIYGVAVLEPVSDKRVSLRGDEEFMAASIVKLPVLAALYKSASREELDLEEKISIVAEDIQDYGNAELRTFPVDRSLSLRESAYRLVNHIDNTAWALLDRRLGAAKISNELEKIGIESSQYSDKLAGYFTTPNDVLLLLEKISDPLYTSEKLPEEMLGAMTETAFEDRIPERLPVDVRVAHKMGSYERNFGDAGVVFYRDSQGAERLYYLAVLAGGVGEYEARYVIQSMSLAVYEALTGVVVDRGSSRAKGTSLSKEVLRTCFKRLEILGLIVSRLKGDIERCRVPPCPSSVSGSVSSSPPSLKIPSSSFLSSRGPFSAYGARA
jgi:beta-lactamase class A